MRFLFAFVFLFLMTNIALAEDAMNVSEMVQGWPGFAKVIGILIGLQLVLRGLAEGLTKISAYTDNHWDNKVAGWISEAAWLLGSILGKFGFGVPSEVVKEIKQPEVKPGDGK